MTMRTSIESKRQRREQELAWGQRLEDGFCWEEDKPRRSLTEEEKRLIRRSYKAAGWSRRQAEKAILEAEQSLI